jgi:Uma2 family endonuclease
MKSTVLTQKQARRQTKASVPVPATMAELWRQLGKVPLERIRMKPAPGTVTERDWLALDQRAKILCELVERTLVEKAMGAPESLLAARLIYWLMLFNEPHDLGIFLDGQGALRFLPELVRIPDVSFISWERLPNHEFPNEPLPQVVPDLTVEVISKGNTKEEMERKLSEYFQAGVRLVWYVYPMKRCVVVYSSPMESRTVQGRQVLTGEPVLPGFRLPLTQLFAPAKKRRR